MKTKDMCLYALFAVLIGVGAFIKLPISIVPVTLQTLFVILAALILKEKAVYSVLLYIGIGLLGIPVFASGGGISYGACSFIWVFDWVCCLCLFCRTLSIPKLYQNVCCLFNRNVIDLFDWDVVFCFASIFLLWTKLSCYVFNNKFISCLYSRGSFISHCSNCYLWKITSICA